VGKLKSNKMKAIITKFTLLVFAIGTSVTVKAQVKFGNSPTTINANSLLELEATNKGLLLPRIALTVTTAAAPLSAHVAGMTVYNTATVSDVTPGYYYNDGAKWVKLGASSNSWNITGNAGTVSGTHFLGTTDNVPLSFRVNNINAGKINNPLNNAFFGIYSGNAITTGTSNSGLGSYSMFSNTSGTGNTAVGIYSMFSNTIASNNTAIGNASLQFNVNGDANTAIGYGALNRNTSGSYNLGAGTSALNANTTGTQNIGLGYGALFSNTTANYNVAVGSGALFSNTTGTQNIGLGYGALYSNTVANNNVGIGYGALYTNTTGTQNTSLGYGALYNNSTGSGNTAIGNNSGLGIATGSNNTIIGANVTGLSATLSNNIILADGAGNQRINVIANGNVGIGTTAPGAKLESVSTVSGVAAGIFRSTGVNTNGIYAEATGGGGNAGYFYATGTSNGLSAFAATSVGIYGQSNTYHGIYGKTLGTGVGGVIGISANNLVYGMLGVNNQYALYGNGDIFITGNLAKGSGTFKIDHPQDPANKYLIHSFVESPDMMNVYNGNIVTDANGDAIVKLPDYFLALNKEYRYQLTALGTFAQAIVAEEVNTSSQFKIKTDKPHVKISWQVTGIRKDPFANAHRIKDVVEKTGEEKGKYIHPELYSQPFEKGVFYKVQKPSDVNQ
jgi:trimeric autotransporter adhesin